MKVRINPFVMGYLAALLVLAALGYCVSGYAIEQQTAKQAETNKHFVSDVGFVSLPPVNMSITSQGQSSRLRMKIGLEVQQKNLPAIEGAGPRITEHIVSYLQTLKREDISRINTTPWLRKEILQEVNTISYPIPVIDVIFRQLVIL